MADICEIPEVHADGAAFAREHLIAAPVADRIAGLFWALADPTRVRIMHALTLTELCNCDLASVLGISESAVSHQMRDLRIMDLVTAERRGRMVYYRLNDTHVRHIFEDTLKHVEEPRP